MSFMVICSNWLVDFAILFGMCTLIKVELITLPCDLKLTWNNRIKNIMVNKESKIIVQKKEQIDLEFSTLPLNGGSLLSTIVESLTKEHVVLAWSRAIFLFYWF